MSTARIDYEVGWLTRRLARTTIVIALLGLLAAWFLSILLFPTAQARLGGAPIYVYDLAAGILFLAFLSSGELARWPRGLPRWPWCAIPTRKRTTVLG